jgi:hypothetical protein
MDHPDDADAAEQETNEQPDQSPDETRDGPLQGEVDETARESLWWEALIVAIVFAAVIVSTQNLLPFVVGIIPQRVYLSAFLGAGVYAITSLIFEPKRSRVEVLRLGYRLIGALPLAAGVYLLSGAFGDALSSASITGLAFLSGLFVRLTLRRLGDLAERLYGSEEETQLPYESGQMRMTASANLWRGWQRLATNQVPTDKREQAVEHLRRAENIVSDQDATAQELARARDLSEEALRVLGNEADVEAKAENDGESG